MVHSLSRKITYEMLGTIGVRPMTEQIAMLSRLIREGEAVWGSEPPLSCVRVMPIVSFLYRRAFDGRVRKFLDSHGVVYKLEEHRRWLDSDYVLTMTTATWSDLRRITTLLETLRGYVGEP